MRHIDVIGEFTQEELLFTYRKVKRELFYEKEHISLERIVQFEENLFENINFLLSILNSRSTNNVAEFINKKDNIGNSNFIFKSIEIRPKSKIKIKKTSENYKRELFEIEKVDYRYLADVSIFFQIIGGLWISRIGHKIDAKFSDNVYGCRIKENNESLKNIPYFKQNHTLYKPYFGDYKKWQNDLFKKIEFLEDKDIVVITSDLKKYYHSIEVDLLNRKIGKIIGEFNLTISKQDEFLNSLLFEMLNKFNEFNNLQYISFYDNSKLNHTKHGLPLTLNVSRILANIYLHEFDIDIIENVKPIYYGRYVDDIIIALEYNNDNTNLSFKNILNSLKSFKISENNELLSVNEESKFKLQFNSEKENIFLFNKSKDKAELNHLKKIINNNSSEWKLLPDTSEYELNNNLDLFQTINSECEEVNSLRKSSGLILKRNKFIKEIINFESDINNYHKKVWVKRLSNFLDITYDFIFDLQNFIDLNKYVPRLFGLLIHCENEEIIKKYFDELNGVLIIFESKSCNSINPEDCQKFLSTKKFIYKKIIENIVSNNSLSKLNSKYILKILIDDSEENKLIEEEQFLENVWKFFSADLHIVPFKDCYYKYEEYVDYIRSSLAEVEIEKLSDIFFNQRVKEFVGNKIHSTKCDCDEEDCFISCYKIFDAAGFYFYTRRVSLLELSVAFKNRVLSDYDLFSELAENYYHKVNIKIDEVSTDISSKSSVKKVTGGYIFIDFLESNEFNNPKVCNTHFYTSAESFDAMVRQIDEPDATRFDRLKKIVNDLIKANLHIDYAIFHELSLPRNLYVQIAEKLSFVGINLIAGLEYKINLRDKTADNQLVFVLRTNRNNGESIALFQSKNIPAIHEGSEIFNRSNLTLKPTFENKLIIKHNNFIYSGLICNDLLDINNRSALCGNIDALFVIAWNQDIETYQHLVKSATLDIHCFVSLCNNKIYGDTRIRAPFKDEWRRDMQKIHGGELDNFMSSELNIKELRNFQTNNVPPGKPFKPFPTGFIISKERKFKK